MILLGTTINALSVAVGALIGVLLSKLLSKSPRLVDLPQVALKAISLCVIFLGIQGAFDSRKPLVLILSLVVGSIIGTIIDIDGALEKLGTFVEKKLVKKEIDVELSWLERRLGKKISAEDVKEKLALLGFEVTFNGNDMHITVPTWRSTGDVGIKADIMEEVARMYGYENFEPTPIVTSFEGAINQLEVDLVRKVKEYLAIRCNMQEIFTYPWMQDELVAAIIGDTKGVLKLSTPPSPTESYIRSTLLPNVCGAVAKNERYFNDFAIFEEAQIFKDENYTSPYDARELLPTQERHVAGAIAGNANDVKALFLRAKGILENMPRYTHMEGFTFCRVEKPSWADETVWLNVFLGDTKIGDLALLSKKASLACGIKNLATMLFEINTDALKPF